MAHLPVTECEPEVGAWRTCPRSTGTPSCIALPTPVDLRHMHRTFAILAFECGGGHAVGPDIASSAANANLLHFWRDLLGSRSVILMMMCPPLCAMLTSHCCGLGAAYARIACPLWTVPAGCSVRWRRTERRLEDGSGYLQMVRTRRQACGGTVTGIVPMARRTAQGATPHAVIGTVANRCAQSSVRCTSTLRTAGAVMFCCSC